MSRPSLLSDETGGRKINVSRLKGILSICLAAAFIISALSGIALWIWKGGMILGIARWIMTGIHTWSSVAMAALVLIHFLLNLRTLRAELRAAGKKDRGQ